MKFLLLCSVCLAVLISHAICEPSQCPGQVQQHKQACLSYIEPDLLCTMQIGGVRQEQALVGYTVDPLLQARYTSANGTSSPWLPEAPSIFWDQEIVVEGSVGGMMSGRAVRVTAHVDYLWCSDRTCEAIADLAYLHNSTSDACEIAMPFAAFPGALTGFGLPHSVGEPSYNYTYENVWATGGYTSRTQPLVNRRRCNASPVPLFSSEGFNPGINIAPTRTTAQMLYDDNAPLAGFHSVYDGRCTTFIYPGSAWYASSRLSAAYPPCEAGDSMQTLVLEMVLQEGSLFAWTADSFSITTRSTAAGLYMGDFAW